MNKTCIYITAAALATTALIMTTFCFIHLRAFTMLLKTPVPLYLSPTDTVDFDPVFV